MKTNIYTSDFARSNANAVENTQTKLRASRRLIISSIQKSRAASTRKVIKPNCCKIRTVELLPSSSQIDGDERSKLLFMMALGLMPNSESKNPTGPIVSINRLDVTMETQVQAKTKERIDSLKSHLAPQQQPSQQSISLNTWSPYELEPMSTSLPIVPDDDYLKEIQIVDLTSDDECLIIEDDDCISEGSLVTKKYVVSTLEGSCKKIPRQPSQQYHAQDPRIRNKLTNNNLITCQPRTLKMPSFMKEAANKNEKITFLYSKVLRQLNDDTKSSIIGKDASYQRLRSTIALPINPRTIPAISSETVNKLTGATFRSHDIGMKKRFTCSRAGKISLVVPPYENVITID